MSDVSAPLAAMALLAAAGLGLGLVTLVERFVRDSAFAGAALLTVAGFLAASDGWPPATVVAGFTILPDDVLFAGLLLAALLRLLRAPTVTVPQRLLLGLAALAAWSTLRGIGIYGLGAAVNELRDFLYYLGGALYFSTALPTRETRARFATYLLRLATLLVVVVLVRWAVLPVVPSTVPFLARSEEGGIRVIDSRWALLMAQAAMVLAPGWFRGGMGRGRTWLLGLLVLETLVLQHRTVWLALIGGIGMLVLSSPELGRRVMRAVAAVTVVSGALILVLIGTEESALPQSPVDPNTVVWRYEGWAALVGQDLGGVEELALGRPMGSGYERQIRGYTVDVTPHNYFLQVFLRMGGAGVVLLLLLLRVTMRRLRTAAGSDDDLLSPPILRIVIAMAALFLVAWKPDEIQGIILGLAVAAAYPNVPVPSLRHGTAAPQRSLVTAGR